MEVYITLSSDTKATDVLHIHLRYATHKVYCDHQELSFDNSTNSVEANELRQNARVMVCIPAYNEAASIANIIKRAANYASEVIVYDDGSVDNTSEVAKAVGATVIRNPKNKGYGFAITALVEAARKANAEVMVTLDSDGQHNPDEIPQVVSPILNGGIDIVIGSRFLNNTREHKTPAFRNLGIKTITRFTQSASYNQLTDAQSGFRAYSKEALSKINLIEEGMAVSTEILLKAKENNLVVKEVPITINYDVNKPSTQHPVFHGIEVLSSVIQFISLRHPLAFYGLPGIAFLIIAIVLLDYGMMVYGSSRHSSIEYVVSSVGFGVAGVVLLATGAILYSIKALLKGRIKEL